MCLVQVKYRQILCELQIGRLLLIASQIFIAAWHHQQVESHASSTFAAGRRA
jgi:hypothetical protein